VPSPTRRQGRDRPGLNGRFRKASFFPSNLRNRSNRDMRYERYRERAPLQGSGVGSSKAAENSDDFQNGNVNFSRRLTVSETRKESGSNDHGHQWGHQEGREGGKNLSKTVDSIKKLVTDKEKSNGKGQEDLLADYGDSGKDSEESIGGIDLLRDAGNQNKQSIGSCLFKKAPTLVDEPFEPLPHEVGLYDS
jgi:hypothetical protein